MEKIIEKTRETNSQEHEAKFALYSLANVIISQSLGEPVTKISAQLVTPDEFGLIGGQMFKLSEEAASKIQDNFRDENNFAKRVLFVAKKFVEENIELLRAVPKLKKSVDEGGWSKEKRNDFFRDFTNALDEYIMKNPVENW